jgi:hypothetical protein
MYWALVALPLYKKIMGPLVYHPSPGTWEEAMASVSALVNDILSSEKS